MEIMERLKDFSKISCPCGKKHLFTISDIIVGKGTVNRVPDIVLSYGAKKPAVISDVNTFEAAGGKVCELLSKWAINFKSVVFSDKKLLPDEKSVGKAFMKVDGDCDMVIAVGSGVINDICKLLSAKTKTPYLIVATAPSMDGYASATSSMELDGRKISIPDKCPDVIIGDTDILRNAPADMLRAGLGDVLAKYISIGEWRISHEITGEYYCERVASLIREALKRCVDGADGLLKRDEEAVKSVFEGLILSGIAMTFAGLSRPASGCEHSISHIWDMRGLEFGTKTELHGIQCAVGTSVCAGIYDKLRTLTPDKTKAVKNANDFDFTEYGERMRKFIGAGAETMIALEKNDGKYDKEKHLHRLETIVGKWDIIKQIIDEEIPPKSKIDEILYKIGIPTTAEELGMEGDLFSVFEFTKDIRDKYILSRFLWDIGETDLFKTREI